MARLLGGVFSLTHRNMSLLCCAVPANVSCGQELRKASGQQLREVQVVQGEAVKQLQDEQQQAKRKEVQLKVRSQATRCAWLYEHSNS
jgi:hypothetical protein